MLIYLCGPSFSGKLTIAKYLKNNENFQILQLIKTKVDKHELDTLFPEALHRFNEVDQVETFLMAERRWCSNWILLGDLSEPDFNQLHSRPFVLIVAVDAPILLRCQRAGHPSASFDFVIQLDNEKYPPSPLANIMAQANLTLFNDTTDLSTLYSTLDHLKLADSERIRPSWDTYFMKLCHWTANRSNCMKRKVGALLTMDHRILATGYNGTPFNTKNCFEGGCPRCNSNSRAGTHLDTCFCLHAEENALLNREGPSRLGSSSYDPNGPLNSTGSPRPLGPNLTLYCTTFPCIQCAKKIVQCKVGRLVYHRRYAKDDEVIEQFLKQSQVQIEQIQEQKQRVFCSDFK